MLKNKIAAVKSFAEDHKPDIFAVAVIIIAGGIGAVAYKNHCDVIDALYDNEDKFLG